MKLRERFTIAASVVAAFALTEACLFFYGFQKNYFAKLAVSEREDAVEKLVRVCQESIWTKNDFLLVNYMKSIIKSPQVRYAFFHDPHGKVLMNPDATAIDQVLADPATQKALQAKNPIIQVISKGPTAEEILDVGHPVFIGNTRVGVARIGYSKAEVDQQLQRALNQALLQFTKFAVLGLMIALAIALTLARSITRPVRELERGAQILGQGKLDHQIPVRRKDELGALAQEFNRMAHKLKELDQMKDDFVSSVSHELRAPMGAIKGYVQLLLKGIHGPLTPAQKEDLETVRASTDRLERFINDVLDLAKLEAGLMKFAPLVMDVRGIAEEIATLFRPIAEMHQIQLEVAIPNTLPQAYTDPECLRRILTNLVHNAIKFTPQGESITLWARPQLGQMQIGVTDTGVGIPPDKLDLIFDKFQQIRQAVSHPRQHPGSGLGLTIVKNIVEQQGGKVWAESKPGHGTTLTFTCAMASASNLGESAMPEENLKSA